MWAEADSVTSRTEQDAGRAAAAREQVPSRPQPARPTSVATGPASFRHRGIHRANAARLAAALCSESHSDAMQNS